MEYKPLPVGVGNFEKLITRRYYFVDKTWFAFLSRTAMWRMRNNAPLYTAKERNDLPDK